MSIAFERKLRRRRTVAIAAFVLSVFALVVTVVGFLPGGADAQNVRPPDNAVSAEGVSPPAPNAEGGEIPGGAHGALSDSRLWDALRGRDVPGVDITSSLPNPQAAVLVQAQGEDWRAFRNGPLPRWGAYALAGMLALLALFYLARGRIRIEHGRAGETVERFNGLERFSHWLLATSFIVLGLSGLNLLYGRPVMDWLQATTGDPTFGAVTFAAVSQAGKWAHNNVAWAFMAGLALVFVLWVRHNLPTWTDVKWIAKGGGILVKGVHPDARKFNAGQKIVFWATILLGLSISMSGIALLFPFETTMMGKTFTALNAVGVGAPEHITAMQEQQYQSQWHAIIGLAMIAVILAHIYIGTLGMEGAFSAMGSGEVDVNWAKEHHNLWLEEIRAEQVDAGKHSPPGAAATPAE